MKWDLEVWDLEVWDQEEWDQEIWALQVCPKNQNHKNQKTLFQNSMVSYIKNLAKNSRAKVNLQDLNK